MSQQVQLILSLASIVLTLIGIVISYITLRLALTIERRQAQEDRKRTIDQDTHQLSTLITDWHDALIRLRPDRQPQTLQVFNQMRRFESGLLAITTGLEQLGQYDNRLATVIQKANDFKEAALRFKGPIAQEDPEPNVATLDEAYDQAMSEVLGVLASSERPLQAR